MNARQYNIEDVDGRLAEDHFARRLFDGIAAEAYNREQELFDLVGGEESKDALDGRQDVMDVLRSKRFDRVYIIIGHSFREAVHSVFNATDKAAHIIYH